MTGKTGLPSGGVASHMPTKSLFMSRTDQPTQRLRDQSSKLTFPVAHARSGRARQHRNRIEKRRDMNWREGNIKSRDNLAERFCGKLAWSVNSDLLLIATQSVLRTSGTSSVTRPTGYLKRQKLNSTVELLRFLTIWNRSFM